MGKRRTIRMDRFRQQLAENVIGPDNLVRVEFGPDDADAINIFIPELLGKAETETFNDAFRAAQDAEDPERAIALLILSHDPTASAEDQLDRWLTAGCTIAELATAWGVERRRVNDELGNFRYRA